MLTSKGLQQNTRLFILKILLWKVMKVFINPIHDEGVNSHNSWRGGANMTGILFWCFWLQNATHRTNEVYLSACLCVCLCIVSHENWTYYGMVIHLYVYIIYILYICHKYLSFNHSYGTVPCLVENESMNNWFIFVFSHLLLEKFTYVRSTLFW